MGIDHDDSDRRRAARIPINAEFAAMPSATYISDLSEYGVFIHTPSPSPRGSKLKLRFTVLLDDPVIVEGEGRVVRQQYVPVPGMGIEFTELSPEMILRINDVVSRQRPRDSGPPLARSDDSAQLGPLFDTGPDENEDEDEGSFDAASTLPRGEDEDTIDTATTLRRDGSVGAPAFAPPKAGGLFRPPSRPGADEHAKTGLYRPVNEELDDPDSEH